MSGSVWMRQSHRWLSMVFTATVIANFIALAIRHGQQPPAWLTYSPLLPLAILLATGLYLFVLPYAARFRGRKNREGSLAAAHGGRRSQNEGAGGGAMDR